MEGTRSGRVGPQEPCKQAVAVRVASSPARWRPGAGTDLPSGPGSTRTPDRLLDHRPVRRLTVPVIATKPGAASKKSTGRRWTFEELAAELPESNLPTELWDGELTLSPAPSFFHQEIVARFYKLLDAWVREHRLGKTGIAPLDMVLAPRRSVQPDVVFISTARLGIIRDRILGAADLVAEVISPESRRRDRFDKRDLYSNTGCANTGCWIPRRRPSRCSIYRQANTNWSVAGVRVGRPDPVC